MDQESLTQREKTDIRQKNDYEIEQQYQNLFNEISLTSKELKDNFDFFSSISCIHYQNDSIELSPTEMTSEKMNENSIPEDKSKNNEARLIENDNKHIKSKKYQLSEEQAANLIKTVWKISNGKDNSPIPNLRPFFNISLKEKRTAEFQALSQLAIHILSDTFSRILYKVPDSINEEEEYSEEEEDNSIF